MYVQHMLFHQTTGPLHFGRSDGELYHSWLDGIGGREKGNQLLYKTV